MALDKSILLQKQIRDNSEDLQGEFLDLKNWEQQMKKADTEIRNAGGDQILPPVRRRKKASKDTPKPANKENSTKSKRIKSSDYSAWEKFDAKKACEELDNANKSDDQTEEPPLTALELEKNHADATVHKVEGNNFVKNQKWSEAVECYGKAIKLFPYDAVFFANRALCHLKMDNLYSAEADCTAAIQLDEFYTKAYHRRATARISLKQYEEAANDIDKILKLEPSNGEAKIMLLGVKKFIENSKTSIMSSKESKEPNVGKKIDDKLFDGAANKDKTRDKRAENIFIDMAVEKEKAREMVEKKKLPIIRAIPRLPEWLPEVQENVDIVNVISKPPHQRSKKPLRTVPIEEIEFGGKIEIFKDSSYNEKTKEAIHDNKEQRIIREPESTQFDVPEAPKTAVQFLLTWRKNTSTIFRRKYFKKIPADRLPIIFQDSMESDTFSEIIKVLRLEFMRRKEPVIDYMRQLSQVKRFRTLTMFMSKSDKEDVRALFDYGKTVEGHNDDVIKDLCAKYEI